MLFTSVRESTVSAEYFLQLVRSGVQALQRQFGKGRIDVAHQVVHFLAGIVQRNESSWTPSTMGFHERPPLVEYRREK